MEHGEVRAQAGGHRLGGGSARFRASVRVGARVGVGVRARAGVRVRARARARVRVGVRFRARVGVRVRVRVRVRGTGPSRRGWPAAPSKPLSPLNWRALERMFASAWLGVGA